MKDIIICAAMFIFFASSLLQAQTLEHDFGDARIASVVMSGDKVKFVTSNTIHFDSLGMNEAWYYNKIIFPSGKVIDFGKQESIISANENTLYTSARKKGEEESFLCEYSVAKNSLSLKKKVKFPDNVWYLHSMQNTKDDFLEYELDENYGYRINFYSSDLKLLSYYQPYIDIGYKNYGYKFNEQYMLMKVQSLSSENKSKLALFNKETLEKYSKKEIILDEGYRIVSTFIDETNIYITASFYKSKQYKYLLRKYDLSMNCVWETDRISRPHRKLYFDHQNKYMYGTDCPIEKINKETGEITKIEFPDYCEKTQKKKNETTLIRDLYVTKTGEIKVLVATSERGIYKKITKDLKLFTFDKGGCIKSINIQKDEIGPATWPFFISKNSSDCRIIFNSKIIKL